MTLVSLSRLRPGERGTIEQVAKGQVNVRQRLLEMGLYKGTIVEFIRSAPMGDPIEVRINGANLSLRRAEAEAIIVKKESQ
jgi:Fe2+ transport system protein FeoA